MSGSAFDDYLKQWREASPQRPLAWLFLRPDEHVVFGALAAMLREWDKARDVSEPQVAAAKLGWWREELQRALAGTAVHPLTQPLFADVRARSVPLACWTAAIDASVATLALPPPADFAAQLDASMPLASAVAVLETRVWFGAGADATRAARVIAHARLVGNACALPAEVGRGRSPLPMNLLARHGLTIEGLAGDGQARRAALRDQLAELRRGLDAAARMSGPLTLFRDVGLQHDLTALDRAVRAEDPLAALAARVHGRPGLLKTWRAARRWRGTVRSESHT